VSVKAGEYGPLTQVVFSYERVMRELVPTVRSAADWAPLTEFVTVDGFERVGTFLEIQNWDDYTVLLTRWASSIDSFETTVRRISELSNLVYYEIEERHRRGDVVNVVNSLTVFAFDDRAKINHLDVYLQQPPP
jgi:hypothetical protein